VTRRQPKPSKFHLFTEPGDVLPVLEHIADHPDQRPGESARQLGISINTWYTAVARLERMGLITVQRAYRDTRRRRLGVTPRGEDFLGHLRSAIGLAMDSPAMFDFELRHAPPPRGSPRAGEILCHLIRDATRRGSFDELEGIARRAAEMGRPAEKWMADQYLAFFRGDADKSRAAAEKSMALLGRGTNSPTRRSVLYIYAATLEYLGDSKGSYEANMRLRKMAREARDGGLEADAWLGLGIQKARKSQVADGIKFMEKSLEVATALGDDPRRAKALANLAFAEFSTGRPTAMARADEALVVARKVGSRMTLARAQLNRALILAAGGQRRDALEALREARRLMRSGGEERGPAALAEWAALVKRILRSRRSRNPEDWRDQALRLAMKRPLSGPAIRPASRSGRGRSG
jgi:DNA-binding MarR family transcriptional regulator